MVDSTREQKRAELEQKNAPYVRQLYDSRAVRQSLRGAGHKVRHSPAEQAAVRHRQDDQRNSE